MPENTNLNTTDDTYDDDKVDHAKDEDVDWTEEEVPF